MRSRIQSEQDLVNKALSDAVEFRCSDLTALIKNVLRDIKHSDQHLAHRLLANVSDHVFKHLRVTIDIAKDFLRLSSDKNLEKLAEVACKHSIQVTVGLKEAE